MIEFKPIQFYTPIAIINKNKHPSFGNTEITIHVSHHSISALSNVEMLRIHRVWFTKS